MVDAAPVPVNTRSEDSSRSLARPAAYFVPGNDHLVHLVRAVHDTQCASVTPHQGQGRVVGNSHGTVHLDSAVEHVEIGVGCHDLNHGNLLACFLFPHDVHLPSRVQDQEASRIDLHARLGNPVLNGLLLDEPTAKCHTTGGAL